MRGRVFVLGTVLFCVAFAFLATPAFAGVQFDQAQWADDRVGMASGTIGSTYPESCTWCPTSLSAAFWTRDGGARWHRVFLGVDSVCRTIATSARAALVVTGDWCSRSYWTRDGGRRWFWTNVVLGSNAVGHGPFLFWARYSRLYRMTPWPPKRPVKCSRWSGVEEGPENGLPEVYAKNICSPVRNAAMRPRVVAHVPEGLFAESGSLASIPGGVVGLVSGRPGWGAPPWRVLVHRFGRTSLVELPPIVHVEPTRIVSEWPRLVVLGARQPTPPVPPEEVGGDPTAAYWYSPDEGRTWRVAD